MPTAHRRIVPGLAIAIAATGVSPSARAWSRTTSPPSAPESNDPQAEQLRDLYSRGQAAFDAGSYETAIAVFEEAYGISKDPNLLFNISICHDRLGHYEDAIAALDRYAAESPDADKADVERRRQSLEIRRERAAQEQLKVERTPAPPPARIDPAPKEDPPPERLFSPAAWTLTGVSIAGFGVGIAFGALSLARKNSADCFAAEGDTVCSGDGARDARDSRRFAIAADVGIGVGAVAAVVVIAIVATRATQRRRSRASAWHPTLGPRSAGLAFSGRF